MKKRIIILCSSFPPENGAAPIRMYHLAKMLVEQGHELTVISAMPNYPTGKIFDAYRGRFIVKEKFENINVIRTWMIPTHSSNKIKRALSLLSYSLSLLLLAAPQIKKLNPDLLIVSSPPFVTGYLGARIARKAKIKLLLNISDLWPKSAYDLGFISNSRFYHFLCNREQKMYARADMFSVQSLAIKNHIEQGGHQQPVFLYRNVQPNFEQAKLPRPEGKRKIVYAGLLGVAQGVFDIVRSVNFTQLQTELHIYGQGYELDKIKFFIEQNPNNGIFYKGSLPAAEVPQMLCQYHVMLIPLSTQIDGAVPSKIFNAFANGLPILFCGHGEAADIVQQTKTGLVNDANDVDSLALNIRRMIEMSEVEYNQLRLNAIAQSEGAFSKEKQDQNFIKFLEQL